MLDALMIQLRGVLKGIEFGCKFRFLLNRLVVGPLFLEFCRHG